MRISFCSSVIKAVVQLAGTGWLTFASAMLGKERYLWLAEERNYGLAHSRSKQNKLTYMLLDVSELSDHIYDLTR